MTLLPPRRGPSAPVFSEGEVTFDGKTSRVMHGLFAIDGYEYRLHFDGRKEKYEQYKPVVERMLATMKSSG